MAKRRLTTNNEKEKVEDLISDDLVLGEESQDSDDDVSDDVASDVSDSDGVASDDDGDVSDDDNIDWGVAEGEKDGIGDEGNQLAASPESPPKGEVLLDEGEYHAGTQDVPSDEEAGHYTATWEDAEHTDTSDEEELRNTVGNIPLEWYEDYEHMGYDLDGKKIMKPLSGDQLDEFLRKMDDPNYWRTVIDKSNGKEIILTEKQMDLIEKIQKSEFPEDSFDPYAPYIDFFTHEKMDHPVINLPTPKRSFLPSLWERKKITKLAQGIRSGKIKPKTKPKPPSIYMLWDKAQEHEKLRPHQYIPAPKVRLPGHAESYNPPPEYLPNDREVKEWEESDPKERRPYLATKHSALRDVPAYNNFINDRFERCLDLYLCPRQQKMRLRVEPEALLPRLPKPRNLQPFPTTESIVYRGHSAMVRGISVEGEGKWLASVSDDRTLKFWEVSTGRCMTTISLPGQPTSVSFCPNQSLSIIAVSYDQTLALINHALSDRLVTVATDSALTSEEQEENELIEWRYSSLEEYEQHFRIFLKHSKSITQVTWHYKGDYFATVMSGDGSGTVYIHQLSKRRSQNPLKTSKGLVQKVLFHPSKPFFFVATQTYVRLYNLVKQELTKKLTTGVKWVSSMDIHPGGDNLIVGSYDKRFCWFDLDLSTRPYKLLRHHRKAIRQVCYHKSYPLFASCSDDGSAIICHGMVYSDLMQNPLIVPVKVLRCHSSVDSIGITDCVFHPSQPWLFTAGADSLIKLSS